MNLFVLDSSSLVRDPEILSRADSNTHFVIPSGVIPELTRGALRTLVDKAVGSGAATIQETSGTGDQAVLEAALNLHNEGKRVVIVSEDRDIRVAAAVSRIGSKNAAECLKDLKDNVKDPGLAKAAIEVTIRAFRGPLLEILAAVALNYAAHFIWDSRATIAESVNVWGTLVLLFMLGILLYCLRGRFRLTYAALEFLVGFATAASVFYPSFNYASLGTLELLRILGGLYIMVRGQDNFGKALEGTRFEYTWKRFAGEPTR